MRLVYSEFCCVVCGEELDWANDPECENKYITYCKKCEIEYYLLKDNTYRWVLFLRSRGLDA
jgi:hypothetical protein